MPSKEPFNFVRLDRIDFVDVGAKQDAFVDLTKRREDADADNKEASSMSVKIAGVDIDTDALSDEQREALVSAQDSINKQLDAAKGDDEEKAKSASDEGNKDEKETAKQKTSDPPEDEADDDDDEKVTKSETDDDGSWGAVQFEKMHDELKKSREETADLRKRLDQEVQLRKIAKLEKRMAADFDNLPFTAEELAKLAYSLSEKSPEDWATVEKILKSAQEISNRGATGEIGSAGVGADDLVSSTYEEVTKRAQKLVDDGKFDTVEKARASLFKSDRKLIQKIRQESEEGR